jgi:lysophospholipase L1-like esterase
VDLSPMFLLPDGRVNDALFLDPRLQPPRPALHPDAAAAARMAEAIEPTLAAMLGDRVRAAQ